ncbi:MAG TPA: hypothetical protein PLH02_00510 [Bacillota bacterium]|nr:hypothetical protein [Bacillota bacterium]HPF42115.1 hypothetical protein [Bacillota bacterium]HPJ85358.1 hypothetical protein [Bacillota bacterium]HPQ61346.1 hypothetical protein [Bacillota bacterium]HRX92252.1 hypothetical protein [Candidatus Izemoplasmatales bacterium]
MSRFKANEDYFAFAKTLSVIPTEDLLELLLQHKIMIPTYIHRFVLRETIYPKVFQTKLYESYTDELRYRLRGFNDYSVYLLEKLIYDYNLDFDAAKYKQLLFDILFLNRELYGLKNAFFDDLEKLKYKYAVDLEKINYGDFIGMMERVIYEPNGYLDGVSLKILKDVFVHSCTLGDLRGLGEKYGVKVPRRINKSSLIEILAARFRLTEQEATLLQDKSVLELEIYAKEKGFQISIDLKKSDMVEYIIYALNLYHQEIAKDVHDYNIPLESEFDSVKIDAIEFQANDQDIPVIEAEPAEKEIMRSIEVDEEPAETISVAKEETILKPEEEPVKEEETIELPEEEQKMPEEIKKTEEIVTKKPVISPEPEIIPEKKEEPIVAPVLEKTATEAEKPQSEIIEFSDEEKDLLDEKINLIIKKYHQKKRKKRFWTIFLITLFAAIIIIGAYTYVYHFTLNPGHWPFGLFE